MTPYFSKQDLRFNLYELLDVEQLTQYSYFEDHNRDTFDMTLDAAEQIADKMLRPLLTDMDRKEPQLINGKIKVHEGMRPIVKRFGEDGWINAPFGYNEGGQQLPSVIHNAAAFIFQSANYSASVYPFLTTGAANLIRSFGSKTLIETYTPKMYTGEWQGTMALTEPDAGSSLSDLSTTATPTDVAGVYHITGQKIYISCGDHDACDNVVHLLIARIKGAPVGTKGISLFVVPQKRVSGVTNDVVSAGVYHKMGYKGAPIAHLMFGSNNDCEGYLVGEANKGLSYMFQMMNEARVGVGMNAAAIGTAAYYTSLTYSKQRPQGRPIATKDSSLPQTLIVNHADVKRLLLFQKSIVEGSLSLLLQCGLWSDLAHTATGDTQERAQLLLDLLTPVAKSYPSEMCCQTTSAAVQVLGGAGYTTDFAIEQYYREARIHPIHEGTTAIHGLDLLGRKIIAKNGKAVQCLIEEITETIAEAHTRGLEPLAKKLQKALLLLQKTTAQLLAVAAQDVEVFLADATLYLEFFGITTIAWQWLKQANCATQKSGDFYSGKLMAARYYFEYELIKTEPLARRLTSGDHVTVDMQPDWF
jgi:alkylation response protein AidB-like acyl-CoA dehydrogenase